MGLLRRNHTDDEHVEVVKGPSLARGPAHLIGTALLVFGLAALIKHNDFPSFGDNFTDGTATGGTLLGIGVNGWTAWLCIATGGLLLFGAAQHLAARTMALIVGLVLGAASVIALRDGDDVLGLAYANGPTKLALGIAAAALLLTALLPRTRKTVDHRADVAPVPRTERAERERHVAPAPAPVAEPVEPAQRSGRFERTPEPIHETQPVHAGTTEHLDRADERRTEVARPVEPHTDVRPTHTDGPAGDKDDGPIDPAAGDARPTATRRTGGLAGRLRRFDGR